MTNKTFYKIVGKNQLGSWDFHGGERYGRYESEESATEEMYRLNRICLEYRYGIESGELNQFDTETEIREFLGDMNYTSASWYDHSYYVESY